MMMGLMVVVCGCRRDDEGREGGVGEASDLHEQGKMQAMVLLHRVHAEMVEEELECALLTGDGIGNGQQWLEVMLAAGRR